MGKIPCSLVGHIAQFTIGSATRRRLFGKPYLPFRRYLGCYQLAFEIGVVLGYTFRDNIVSFAKLFSEPGRELEVISAVQQIRRDLFMAHEEAQSFIELAISTEESRIHTRWRESGLPEAKVNYLDQHHEMPFESAFNNI
jgi:hypothetical protein